MVNCMRVAAAPFHKKGSTAHLASTFDRVLEQLVYDTVFESLRVQFWRGVPLWQA